MKPVTNMPDAFRYQAKFCRKLNAPFAATIMDLCAENYSDSIAFRSAIGDWQGDPVQEAFPLRFLGAWHALALKGLLPWHTVEAGKLWPVLEQALHDHTEHFSSYIASPPQTNEVGRSAALMLGFLDICAQIDKPLALYEIGCSAGLNLRWDQYQYWSNGVHIWGNTDAATKIHTTYTGKPVVTEKQVRIASRKGCDIAPIDIEDPERCDRLRSYVWPDHTARRTTLENAIEAARSVPADLFKMPAQDWVEENLSQTNTQTCDVLFHSIMWMYMSREEQEKITSLINERGLRATTNNPFFYLALEFVDGIDKPAKLQLTKWPGGDTKTIATANPHCTLVDIL